MGNTVTIGIPGKDPITITEEQLAKVTKKLEDRARQKGQDEAFTDNEMGKAAAVGVAAEELKQFIERVERLEEEKKAIGDDVRDIYAEAKGRGFDTKAIRAIIKLRAKEPHEREEEEAMIELYKSALGMA